MSICAPLLLEGKAPACYFTMKGSQSNRSEFNFWPAEMAPCCSSREPESISQHSQVFHPPVTIAPGFNTFLWPSRSPAYSRTYMHVHTYIPFKIEILKRVQFPSVTDDFVFRKFTQIHSYVKFGKLQDDILRGVLSSEVIHDIYGRIYSQSRLLCRLGLP